MDSGGLLSANLREGYTSGLSLHHGLKTPKKALIRSLLSLVGEGQNSGHNKTWSGSVLSGTACVSLNHAQRLRGHHREKDNGTWLA